MTSADPQPLAAHLPPAPAARRFETASLAAPLVDLLLFNAAVMAGMLWVPAHLGSFAIATLVNYFVKLRPALLASGRGSSLRLHALLLVASLMTLFLRGGLLGLLTQQLGWPAQLAIVPAVLAGVGVSLVANDLLLSPILSSRGQLLRRLAVVIPAYALLLRLLYIGQVELLRKRPTTGTTGSTRTSATSIIHRWSRG